MISILLNFIFPPFVICYCSVGSIVISKSTEFAENCEELSGRIRIDASGGDTTDDELSNIFENIRKISGVVQIWNTNLEKISFLSTIAEITGDPLDKSLSIVNNTRLSYLNISRLATVNGIVQIKNNPLLDLKQNCEKIHELFFTNRQISGNKFDCGCDIRGEIRYLDVEIPLNCFVIYGDLNFVGVHPPMEMLNRLKTVQKLYGTLSVQRTNLETLGFLEGLTEIQSGIDSEYTINIQMNEYLGRLDLINFKRVSSKASTSKLEISSNTNLCFDPEFIQILFRSEMPNFFMQNGGTCTTFWINNPGSYCSGKLSLVSDSCKQYIGDIIYANSDKYFYYQENFNFTNVPDADIKRIQQFESIFGVIYIEGSRIQEFVLPNLREIYQMKEVYNEHVQLPNNEAISLFHNHYLEKFELPKIEFAYRKFALESNYNLTTDNELCLRMTSRINTGFYMTFDNSDCAWYLNIPTETTESTESQTSQHNSSINDN